MIKLSGPVYVQEPGEILLEPFCDPNASIPIDPYGPEHGTVTIRLAAAELPEEVTLFFGEHRPQARKQRVITARMKKDISVDLPSGEYTMQVLARGFETIRGLVEVDPKRPFVVDAMLQPRKHKGRTFEERLAKYGIDISKAEIGELNVPPNKTLVLNNEARREQRAFKMLQTDSIARLKEWIGSEDTRFGHSQPVFGPLPDGQLLARLRDDHVDLQQLDRGEVQAVTSIAREYVHGNSRAVALYETLLNEALKLTVRDAMTRIPLYYYRVVTIGAGATLEIGSGSAVFTCDELRVHKTGNLRPVADVKIEVGTYTEFQ